MTPWEEAIDAVLRSLRAGEVVTYGEVAMEAGRPGAARSVGSFLAGSGGHYAWWRVVTASGRFVPGHEAEQARRLRAEGVEVDEDRGRVLSAGRAPRHAPSRGSRGRGAAGRSRP